MTTANVNIKKVLLRRGNTAQNNNYTGVFGEITVDTQVKTLRIHDGVTAGGNVLNAAGVVGAYSNVNTAAYLTSQSITSANIGAFQTFANANANVQATSINSINANVGAYQTFANANAATQTTEINSLRANITAANTLISNLRAVSSNILPSANVTYSLGSSAYQWKDLWVSNNTIYIGNTPLTISNGNLLVNGNLVTGSGGSTYGNTQVASYLSRGNVTLGNVTITDNVGSEFQFLDSALRFPGGNGAATYGAYVTGNGSFLVYPTNDSEFMVQTFDTTPGMGSRQWKIRADGNLEIPDDATIFSDANVRIYATDNVAVATELGGTWLFGTDGTFTAPGEVYGQYFSLRGGNLSGTIGSLGYSDSDISLNSFANVRLTTVDPESGPQWTFGTDGTTTFPDTTINAGTNKIDIKSSDYVELWFHSQNGVWQNDSTLNQDAYVFVQNDGVGIQNVRSNDGNGGPTWNYEWKFNNDGNLTIPGSINFTSSPAGSITGASLVSAQQFYSHGNVTIAGNLTVNGTTTTISTNSYVVSDNIVQFADGNPADTLDLGFVAHRTVNSTLQHTGLIRDASAGNWKLFSNVTTQPGNTVDFTNAVYDDLVVGNISSPTVTDLYANAATQATSINTINNTLTSTNVAIGYGAGATSQGGTTVAVGAFAGQTTQGLSAVAVGFNAGQTTQGTKSVAIGMTSGYSLQGNYAVAIGDSAGYTNQGAQAIAIGRFAGLTNQANNTIILNATGANLNATTANTFIVAPVRNDVANVAQVMFYNTTSKEITYGNTISVAGNISAGNISTRAITLTNGAVIKDNSGFGVSFGEYAGTIAQGAYAVAILGGYDTQGADAIAIGQAAGSQQQGTRAVAIGRTAGQNNQGDYAISIGWGAGTNNQPARTIILNGSGSAVNGIAAQTDSFYVAPVRNDVANVAQVMFYNTTSKEVTYGNTISIAGNINANQYNFANGVNILSTVGAGSYGNTEVAAYLANYDGGINFTASPAVITGLGNISSANFTFANGVNILSTVTATANTGNITFSDTTIGTAGGAGQGIILNSAGSGEIAMLDYVGINNTNPGYWLHIGDGSIGAINNTGNISIDYNNGLDSSRATTILGYAWWDAGSNGNNNRGIGAHRQFGIYKNDDLYTTKYIEFDLTSGNANLTNIAVTRVTTTNGIFWSNGTNILDGITGGGGTTYTDANVVSLLAANSSVFVGNTNNINTYSLQSNITQVFIGGNTTIASGNANVTNSTSLLHNMYFAANGTRLVRNTGAGVGLLSFDSTGFTVSGLVTVQTANSAPALPHWIKANASGLFAPSGFTTSTMTASGTVTVGGSGIQTSLTTFPLVNQTATTINFGGTATTINMGSSTIGGSGSNVFVGNAIGTSTGNLTVRAFGTYNSVNSLTSAGGYATATYTNIAVTGGSGTGMLISMSGVASGYLGSATVTNPGTGYRNGETITIPAGNPVGSLGGSFVIGNYNAAYSGTGNGLANYSFGIDGNLTLPGNVTIAGVGSIRYANGVNYASTVTGTYSNTNVAAYLTTATIETTGNITAGNLTTTGTYTVASITTTGTYGNITGANVISANTVSATNYLFANGVNILSTVPGTYSNTNVAAYLTTGVTTANLTATGNIVQQSAYYETFSNVANSGGNLTCNFANGSTFYATLTANVTVNFSNVVATSGRVTGATLIVDQGATPYSVANLQINGGSVQSVRWAGGVGINVGTASNTDIMSFSLISLDGTNWRVLGQVSNYG